jgi:hypothetical protein
MCERANEVQDLWKVENGDIVFWEITKSIKIITNNFTTTNFADFIWLPTQENLQEILQNYIQNNEVKGLEWGDSKNRFIIRLFAVFAETHLEFVYDFNSLWLLFIMEKIYRKIWNGKNWVKEGKE